MRFTPAMLIVTIIALWCNGCSETEPEPQAFEDVEDITTSSDVTPYGEKLQLADESGNIITVNFPPGAVRDTTTVTLTLLGKHRNLPIEERHLRIIRVLPEALVLHKAVEITVEYHSSINELNQSALFQVQEDNWMSPLSDHIYNETDKSLTANTLFLGEFAEGKMSIDQINTQLEHLLTSRSINLKNAPSVSSLPGGGSADCELYKAAWDDWMMTAGAITEFFSLRYKLGYYNNLPSGEDSFQEDLNKVCSNIILKAVEEVLKLGEPQDPCCPEYAETIERMMHTTIACGGQGSTLDQMNDSYDKVHSQCHTYLDITTEVNIDGGGLLIMTSGEVILTLEGTGDGEANVTGSGELEVTGSGSAGGDCSATVAGQTFVTVTGTRDAAYVYSLTVDLNQVAMMTTVCGSYVVETPLVGGSAKEVTLEPGNGYSISETEGIDEGTATTQVTLINPYNPVPEPE